MIHGEMDVHLEWAIPSPPPFYNFKQIPLVRGLDAYWIEKMNGKKEMTPAEPLGDIHMPNSSFIPFMISLGLFIAAFGAMYRVDYSWGLPVLNWRIYCNIWLQCSSVQLKTIMVTIFTKKIWKMKTRGLRHNASK